MSLAAPSIESIRLQGRQAFRANGLPHRRLEAWKYTPLRGLEPGVDELASIAPTVEFAGDVAGLEVLSLHEALQADDIALSDLLSTLDTAHPSQALSALNNAALDQGLLIRVRAGVDGGRLELRWPAAEGTAMHHSRVCIVLEPNARLELFESFAAGLDAPLNVVTQVQLQEGACLSQSRLQAGSESAALVTRTEVLQAGQSSYRFTGLDLDGQLVRHDLRAQLQGEGAVCAMNGVYLPTGDAHIDNHLEIEHQAENCLSSQLYRGVLKDRGRAVFNGRVHVYPGADGTEARQSNANLLLSQLAEVNTKPELEIEADEVIASHGATVGQLDEDAVFYLRSRGLGEAAARELLTGAFCRAVLDELEQGPSREALDRALEAAIGGSA